MFYDPLAAGRQRAYKQAVKARKDEAKHQKKVDAAYEKIRRERALTERLKAAAAEQAAIKRARKKLGGSGGQAQQRPGSGSWW